MAESSVADQNMSPSVMDPNANSEGKSSIFQGADILKQITIIVALAICLAVSVLIVLWVQEPEYRPLGKMSTEQMVQVLDTFEQQGIEHKIELGVIQVVAEQYQQVKMLLTREGVELTSKKDDFLNKNTGFGVSQRMEQARLKANSEANLARAITEFNSVSRAKVILALPKENVFSHQRKKPSATVVVTSSRAVLDQGEVDAIVDIVASAVAGLEPNRVTVTDSKGRLLHSGSMNESSSRVRRELELAQQKEAEYRTKIESILLPILGLENFSSQVDVDLDFTKVEETAKRFNPKLAALRSERTVEDTNSSGIVGGIPGALSNQPPTESDIPQETKQTETESNQSNLERSHKEATRNYELDTVISHTRQPSTRLRRISVSVAVNHKVIPADPNVENSEPTKAPRTEEELNDIRRLLEGAIGFNKQRGDTLEVITMPFLEPEIAPLIPPSFWEQSWFWRVVKLVLGSLVILVLILSVVRPMLKRLLLADQARLPAQIGTLNNLEVDNNQGAVSAHKLPNTNSDYAYADDGSIHIPDLKKDEDVLNAIRSLVSNEPELSTQVVKTWLEEHD